MDETLQRLLQQAAQAIEGSRFREALDFLERTGVESLTSTGFWFLRGYAFRGLGDFESAADSFDAMTSPRPYRSPRSEEEAREELTRCSGTQFDPACVEAFFDALDQPAALKEAVG